MARHNTAEIFEKLDNNLTRCEQEELEYSNSLVHSFQKSNSTNLSCLRESSLGFKDPNVLGSIALAYRMKRMAEKERIKWVTAKLEPLDSRTESSMSTKIDPEMYPNPFNRRHSTIRQVIDRLIRPNAARRNSRVATITRLFSWRKKTPFIFNK